MVGVKGLEPSTPWSQTRCATRLRYTPLINRSAIIVKRFVFVNSFLKKNENFYFWALLGFMVYNN